MHQWATSEVIRVAASQVERGRSHLYPVCRHRCRFYIAFFSNVLCLSVVVRAGFGFLHMMWCSVHGLCRSIRAVLDPRSLTSRVGTPCAKRSRRTVDEQPVCRMSVSAHPEGRSELRQRVAVQIRALDDNPRPKFRSTCYPNHSPEHAGVWAESRHGRRFRAWDKAWRDAQRCGCMLLARVHHGHVCVCVCEKRSETSRPCVSVRRSLGRDESCESGLRRLSLRSKLALIVLRLALRWRGV